MKKGFTLLELIIVVIVIGILASIALPKYITITEKARRAEGMSMLGAYRSAQMRYYASKSAYATACGDLDLTMTTPQNFAAVTSCGTTDLALVTRTSGYTLKIAETGVITCTDVVGATITCAQAGCTTGGSCQ